ncbi:MAG: type II toxin-antitoxin system HicA family toxin [Elusimicrobia bacterium]|nr:type II toxin-antitoxin system HicA family toxin [Elusimicrobiota bacterium]MDE2426114.1 type II toxin-antitoxin system HicA family toxin [Elusimicrobiota bacterium]
MAFYNARRLLLAAGLLALAAAASAGPLYEGPGDWAPVLAASVGDMNRQPASQPSIRALGSAQDIQALAPLAFELDQHGLLPNDFLALPPKSRRRRLREAAASSVRALRGKLSQLAAAATNSEWALDQRPQPQALQQLYALALDLREVADHYGPYLGPDADSAREHADSAAQRYSTLRQAAIDRYVARQARPAAQPQETLERPALSKDVQALYQKALRPQDRHNWSFDDLVKLYRGFGFHLRESHGSHKQVFHPDFPELSQVIVRHAGQEISASYVKKAVHLIRRLQQEVKSEDASAARPAVDTSVIEAQLPPPLPPSIGTGY